MLSGEQSWQEMDEGSILKEMRVHAPNNAETLARAWLKPGQGKPVGQV